MNHNLKRRTLLKSLALGTGAIGMGGMFSSFSAFSPLEEETPISHPKGNIKHSVSRWPFVDIPLEEFAATCVELGITGMDLLKPSEWEIVQKQGLEVSMGTAEFAIIEHGFNDPSLHNDLQRNYRGLIDQASANGVKNIICFSGNKRKLDAKTGIRNCAQGLIPLLDYAAEKDVVMVMELLNSKVNHPDYQCDHTEWGVALADEMGKSNFKLLYDIYHMQIMEGDVIATIRKYHPYINHYHTAGVPGRNEINETQELFYPAIMRAIVGTGFEGFVAQEFIPTYEDKISSLKEAIKICDV